MIRNRFSKGVRYHVPSPSGIAKVYEERLLDDGTMGIVQTGKHDLISFVDAPRESCLVYNILDRFQKTGDVSLFSKEHGFFADVTEMPKDLMEAKNLLLSIDKKFSSLSSDIKEKFDNNSQNFASAIFDGSLADILGVGKSEDSIIENISEGGENNE